jgi:hypothetical protein
MCRGAFEYAKKAWDRWKVPQLIHAAMSQTQGIPGASALYEKVLAMARQELECHLLAMLLRELK